MLSYMSLLQPTHGGSELRSSIFPLARMHTHVGPFGEVKERGSAPLFRVLDMKSGVKNTLNNK